MHSHEFWEISYVYEGRGTHHFADGSTAPIKEGEFVFISPDTEHCITTPPPEKGNWVRVCNLLITQDYMDKLKERFLCAHELDEYKHLSHGSGENIENTALSLLIYITRLYEKRLKRDTVTTTKNQVIDDLIRYIQSNFGSNLTLDYLAPYAHFSPEYLSRYFKKCTGMKLSEFITKTRLDKAKLMLRTSSSTICDISEYCGYKSISNFQKAFKKAAGMIAGDYRKSSVW